MTNNANAILTLDIERAGKTSTFEAASGAMLVGSGSHCDVRLPPEEVAVEQLLLEQRGERVYLRSLTSDGALRLGNAPFEEGELASGTKLTLGELQLRVGVRSQSKRTSKAGDSSTQTLITRVLLVVGIAVGGYKVAFPDNHNDVLGNAVDAPALFTDAAVNGVGCNVTDERDAAFQAERWALEASLKRERAPYYPKDGVASVRLYEGAEACFRKAGRAADAERTHATVLALRASLEDEFHVRQVRLERFLQREKHDNAQREVAVLMTFVAHQDGEYVQWLGAVQRELSARFASTVGSR
jgi:hypothetical protein